MKHMKYLCMLLLVVVLCCSSAIYKPPTQMPLQQRYSNYDYIPAIYRKYTVDICAQYGVPIKLVASILQQESGWNKKAVGVNYYKNKIDSYDSGLGQLNSRNLEYFSSKFNDNKKIDPFNPFTSIKICVKYLSWAYNLTSSWKDAIIVYNAGYTRWKENRVPQSTYQYVKIIIPTEGLYDKE